MSFLKGMGKDIEGFQHVFRVGYIKIELESFDELRIFEDEVSWFDLVNLSESKRDSEMKEGFGL